MPDVSKEISFQTARSGGKGGQNVNKVETMVEGYFRIADSSLLSAEQKAILHEKLSNKINADGELLVKSQQERSQLANKQLVVKKMNALIKQALLKPKQRRQTKPSKAAKEKRIASKKKKSEVKLNRKKVIDL